MSATTVLQPPPTKKARIVALTLQLLGAAAFFASGVAKLMGVPMMVEIFAHIGLGQWFRMFTGLVEVTGALALLFPATAAFGGLLLATTMTCAIATHLLVIGGNPAPAIVLLTITATVAWLRRGSFMPLLARFRRVPAAR